MTSHDMRDVLKNDLKLSVAAEKKAFLEATAAVLAEQSHPLLRKPTDAKLFWTAVWNRAHFPNSSIDQRASTALGVDVNYTEKGIFGGDSVPRTKHKKLVAGISFEKMKAFFGDKISKIEMYPNAHDRDENGKWLPAEHLAMYIHFHDGSELGLLLRPSAETYLKLLALHTENDPWKHEYPSTIRHSERVFDVLKKYVFTLVGEYNPRSPLVGHLDIVEKAPTPALTNLNSPSVSQRADKNLRDAPGRLDEGSSHSTSHTAITSRCSIQ